MQLQNSTPQPNMTQKIWFLKLISIGLLMGLAAYYRLLPHPHNMTPIGAMALYGGLFISPRFLAFILPMGAMALSDFALYQISGYPPSWPTYFCFLVEVLVGLSIRRRWNEGKNGFLWVGTSALLCSIFFFVVTNFFIWYKSTEYAQNWAGLLFCYEMALPFFRNTLLGDICFIMIFVFGWLRIENYVLHRLISTSTDSSVR